MYSICKRENGIYGEIGIERGKLIHRNQSIQRKYRNREIVSKRYRETDIENMKVRENRDRDIEKIRKKKKIV